MREFFVYICNKILNYELNNEILLIMVLKDVCNNFNDINCFYCL